MTQFYLITASALLLLASPAVSEPQSTSNSEQVQHPRAYSAVIENAVVAPYDPQVAADHGCGDAIRARANYSFLAERDLTPFDE